MASSSLGDVSIRVARREDIDAVLSLWEQAPSPAVGSTPDGLDSILLLIEHADDALFVAEHQGLVVGALIAVWDGWRGNMYRLAVLPAYRRRGIARRLVEAGHEALHAKGARRITALVAREEPAATGLWRAAGYQLDEDRVRFVRNL
jgi:ribosomal protein S18 acetylase RimI-like enzyme